MKTVSVVAMVTAVFLLAGIAPAKTIVLTADDWDQAAHISANAPQLSWANMISFFINPNDSLLVRYTLEKIPKDMRITNAELIVPVHGTPDHRFFVWRILKDWGYGVNYFCTTVRPEETEWSEPGCGGLGTDRALRPTAVHRILTTDISPWGQKNGASINVTKDVALWHSGAVPNNGWLFTSDGNVGFHSPFARGLDTWKLRITYEPR